MYFYTAKVEAINRERLITNERLLQNTVTRSLADDFSQHQGSLRLMLGNLASAVQVTSGGDITGGQVQAPELRALLENFVSSSPDLAYATLLNSEGKGVSAGRVTPDAFLRREMERAYVASHSGQGYNGRRPGPGQGKVGRNGDAGEHPVTYGGRFLGMVATVVDLQFMINRLQEATKGGLTPYVVDSEGRLVAAATSDYVTGQDMTGLEIVRNFVDQGSQAQFVAPTVEFELKQGKKSTKMLGTYSPALNLDWAVIAQKPRDEAYRGVYEMESAARKLAIMAVMVSLAVGFFAARWVSHPLEVLTASSRAIARGDFSQRVYVKSRTEIGELADTFNHMTEELEHFVLDLRRAAAENRELFLNSIQMLAGAVDEKDPYTRGHSDRVTKYSVMIATEMRLAEESIEVVRVAAQLHDVGKIGIEDRILKKPGALTNEEFAIMKMHTTKGANILRQVTQLKEMIPGIELHHESLDGRGYPHGLKDEQIPLLPRIIAVADTFDALTTNRPYQQAHDPQEALRIIRSLSGKRLDPNAVTSICAIYDRGEIRVTSAAEAAMVAPPVEVAAEVVAGP